MHSPETGAVLTAAAAGQSTADTAVVISLVQSEFSSATPPSEYITTTCHHRLHYQYTNVMTVFSTIALYTSVSNYMFLDI